MDDQKLWYKPCKICSLTSLQTTKNVTRSRWNCLRCSQTDIVFIISRWNYSQRRILLWALVYRMKKITTNCFNLQPWQFYVFFLLLQHQGYNVKAHLITFRISKISPDPPTTWTHVNVFCNNILKCFLFSGTFEGWIAMTGRKTDHILLMIMQPNINLFCEMRAKCVNLSVPRSKPQIYTSLRWKDNRSAVTCRFCPETNMTTWNLGQDCEIKIQVESWVTEENAYHKGNERWEIQNED